MKTPANILYPKYVVWWNATQTRGHWPMIHATYALSTKGLLDCPPLSQTTEMPHLIKAYQDAAMQAIEYNLVHKPSSWSRLQRLCDILRSMR